MLEAAKVRSMVVQGEGLPAIKSHDNLNSGLVRSRDRLNTLYLHLLWAPKL